MSRPLREICKGRWPSLMAMFGLDRRYLTGRHGPCPVCGGNDRFRFDDKGGMGSWICSQCGSGDGFSLLMRVKGWDFKQVAAEVEAIVGKAEPVESRRDRDEKALRDAMNRIWSAGKPIETGDVVDTYLRNRGIVVGKYPNSLRFMEKCLYHDDEKAYYPAMLAKVTGPDGKPSTVHRTYLEKDGRKARVASPRRLMPGKVEKGSAVRLAKAEPVMGIAEGIETALSASQIWGVPCWAAVNAGMLMAWEPPPSVQEVIVFGDHDLNYTGQAAAYALANKLTAARGLRAIVELPPRPGDWNDELTNPSLETAA